jgi:hypothetical protein
MRSAGLVVWLLSAGLAAGQTAPRNDWLIVPGSRVGPISVTTIRADLPRYFAAAEDGEIELDEGLMQPATLVSKNVAAESLAIVWTGSGADAHPKQIFLCRGRRRGPCRWHTEEGITDGTKLDELESLNGRSFTVSGFGMNYGGNVQSWEGGKLEALDCGGRLTLTLDGERERGGPLAVALSADERHSITGDKSVPSAMPAMRKVNPAVTEMVFYFPTAASRACR